MEIFKRQVKRITSIILIITILVGVLPNFGLLKESNATSEVSNDSSKIIIKKGNYDADNKVIALEVWIRNINFVSFDLTFSYPSEILTPLQYSMYEMFKDMNMGSMISMPTINAANITTATKMNTDLPLLLDTNNSSELKTADGTIRTYVSEKNLNNIDIRNDEKKIYTIYFRIEGDNSIDSITSDMFQLIYKEDVADPSQNGFNIVEHGTTENIPIYNTSVCRIEGFRELPKVTSLSIQTNPSEGQKYVHGKEIDLTELELIATYSDNTTKPIAIDDPDLKITTGEKIGAIADIGNSQITFEYKGKTITLDVNVIDPVVKIEVIDEDKILMQGIDSGEKIPKDEEGLYVKTTTASGNINQVSLGDKRITLDSDKADITKVPSNKQQSVGGGTFAGLQTITVTYKENETEEEVTTTFDILVNDIVDKIEISTINPPIKEFTINDIFTKSGAIVIVGASGHKYDEIPMSSDSIKVTELDGKPVDLSKTTSRELLVSFGEATTRYEITVQNKVTSIEIKPNKVIKLKYDKKINEQQDLFAGITITEIMADGTIGDTKNLDFSWIQNTDCYDTSTNKHTLTVKYPCNEEGDFIEGKIIVQVINEVTGIKVEGFENKKFVYKDSMNYDDITLTIERVSGFDTYIADDILDLLEYNLENYGVELKVSGFNSNIIENNQKVTFTYNEEGSQTVSTDVYANIDKATLEAPECEQLTIVAGKAISTIEDQLPTTEYGSVIWKNPTQTLAYVEGSDNIKEVSAIYKMNDTYSPYYKDVEFTVKVQVEKRLVSSIEITKAPEDIEYIEGQDFDPTGMEITVTYNDGDTSIIDSDYATNGVTFTPSTNLQTTDKKIVVSYGEKTAEQPITVEAKKVTKIEITQPTKNEYVEGQKLDLTGMTVTVTYNDDTTKDITAENSKYEVNPENGDILNTVGTTTITVTYTGTDAIAGIESASTSVEVEAKVVTKIEVTQPTKNKYVAGQALDLTGMTVTANYNDNTTKDITAENSKYEVNPENGDILNTVGTTTITVTYTGTDAIAGIESASTTVEVEAKVVEKIEVTTLPTNTEYVEGHPFDPTGMIITAYYNDGTDAPTEDYEISPNGNLGRTDTTITITYTGEDIEVGEDAPSTTLNVTVIAREIEKIEITKVPNKTSYIEGQSFDPAGMEITVTYNDNENPLVIDSDYATKGVIFAPSTNLQITDTKVTATYEGHTATQDITVEAKVVTEIKVTTEPDKTSYIEGQKFDPTGMVVTAYYNDGTDAPTEDYEISPKGDLTLDDNEITITYTGEDIEVGEDAPSTTQSITVEAKVVTEIKVTTEPENTKYVEGQKFDKTGMIVTAYYNDGTDAPTEDYEISPNGDLTLNDNEITIRYTGEDIEVGEDAPSTTQSITVEAKVVEKIEVTTLPTNTEYVEGHPFDSTGMVVTAYYNDKTSVPTEEYEISPNGNLGRTDTTITITYTGDDIAAGKDAPSITINVTVIAREIEKIEITKAPDKTSYFEGQSFDPAGMEITVTYNDHENPLVIKDDYKDVTFSPSLTAALKTSNSEITVTYEGYTAKQAITVEEDYVTEITVNYPNNFQQVGKNVDLTNTTIQKKWASELSHGADDTEAVTLSMISSDSIANGKFTTPGNVEITVTYDNGKTDKPTAKFNVVVEDAIQSITLNSINTSYWVGDEIDPNISISVNYANPDNNKTIGISSPDWSKCVIKGIDMSKPGTYTLKVAYGDYETEGKTITVKDYVKEIRVVNNKQIYKLNEDGSFNIQVNKYMASEPEKAIPVIKGNYTLSVASVDTSAIMTNDVTVSYTNEKNETLTAIFNVQVINATAKAVLETTPTNMPEIWGDNLDLAGASVKVEKQDGTYETITLPNDDITVSTYNSRTLAKQTISFTYKYKELNEMNEEVTKTMPVEGVLNITLQDYWTGEIRVSGVPTTSIKGQELDLSSAKVSKVMASGALTDTTSILGSMISNFDKNIEGKQTITVTHFGKSATLDVTVTDYITSISMNKLPNKINYTQGEAIDVTGAVLNVTKQSGIIQEIAITKEMISGYNPNKVGQQTIIVNYYGYITSFVVNVKAKTTNKPTTPTKPNTPTKPTNPSDNTPIIDEPIVPEETKKYLVTFLNYDGTILKTEEVESGKSATEPKLKTRKGYKFIGWDKDFDVVEADMEVTAQYEKIQTIKESPKPTQTLGEKDEVKESNKIQETLIPATIGLAITGLLLLLIAILTKKNVEIYAIYGEEKKLIGREKIGKRNNKILLDSYKSKLENATAIELRISEKTVEKLEGEVVEVVVEGKTKKYKMTNVIIMKR